jgi:hypothetical protein
MSVYTEEFTKEFRVGEEGFGLSRASPTTLPPAETRLRVNMLTHRSEKSLRSLEGLSQRAALC